MRFKLIKTLAKEVSIKVIDSDLEEPAKKGIKLEQIAVNTRVADEEVVKNFAISFEIQASLVANEILDITIDYWAFFESDAELTDEFLNGPFTRINAPAIAFPYLRAFVTNLLVSAGYPAAYLPTINFVELDKKQSQ